MPKLEGAMVNTRLENITDCSQAKLRRPMLKWHSKVNKPREVRLWDLAVFLLVRANSWCPSAEDLFGHWAAQWTSLNKVFSLEPLCEVHYREFILVGAEDTSILEWDHAQRDKRQMQFCLATTKHKRSREACPVC